NPEERQLEPVLLLRSVPQVPRVVPPLDPRIRVRAMVARERDFASIGRTGDQQDRGDQSQPRIDSPARHHSSCSAEAGETPDAMDPGKIPASTEAPKTARAAAARRPAGTVTATVHPKDWGLMTATSRSAAAAAGAATGGAVAAAPVSRASIRTERRICTLGAPTAARSPNARRLSTADAVRALAIPRIATPMAIASRPRATANVLSKIARM